MITVDKFKLKLRDESISDLEIVQQYIIDGPAFVFEGNAEMYYKLRRVIALKFGLNPHDVIMVGSAKLGFSISPSKRWKPFSDEADIDMAIISPDIFDRFWKELYDFNIKLTDRTEEEEAQYKKFLDYFFKGWLRPDVFPFSYAGRDEWLGFFKSISYGEFGERHKISGAVFHDWEFCEAYHIGNIREIRNGGVK